MAQNIVEVNTTTRSVFTKFQGTGAPENGDNLCFDTNRYGIGTTYYDVDNDDLFLRIDRQGDATDFIAIIDGSTPETLTVSENGTYIPEDGKSFNKAVVNVPQPSFIHTIKVKRTSSSEWEEVEFNMFPPLIWLPQYYAFVDLNDFNASGIYRMYRMFYGRSSLVSLELGGNFNTSNVTNMNDMFMNCSSLVSLVLGDKFDTSNVELMSQMFYGCSSLVSLELGDNFNTSNVNDMDSMFFGCSSLTEITVGLIGTLGSGDSNVDMLIDQLENDIEGSTWTYDETTGKIIKQ